MATLLNIISSPRKNRSASITVADVFLKAYQDKHPGDTIDALNLWEENLPPFDGAMLDAKYAVLRGETHTREQAAEWKKIEDIIARFKAADKYVLSMPMWNFGIPYILKHYFDLLIQPGLTFSFSPETGYKGLVTGKPVVVIAARGGAYPENTPQAAVDYQVSYTKQLLGFIGFTDIKVVPVENTLGDEDVVKSSRDKAVQAAEIAAENF